MYRSLYNYEVRTVLVSNRAIYLTTNEDFSVIKRRIPYCGMGIIGTTFDREHAIIHTGKSVAEGDFWFSSAYGEKLIKRISHNYKKLYNDYLPAYSL